MIFMMENAKAKHFDFDGLEFEMEGQFRKGHFDGVGTIVNACSKLLLQTMRILGRRIFNNWPL